MFATSYELMRVLSLHIPPPGWQVRVLECQAEGCTALPATGVPQHRPLLRHAPAAQRARVKVEPPADNMDEAFNLAFSRGRQLVRKQGPRSGNGADGAHVVRVRSAFVRRRV